MESKKKGGQSMNRFNKGDHVMVCFISESRTEFSGKEFKGSGQLDLVENNRVYGRLYDGTPFTCSESDCTEIIFLKNFSLLLSVGYKNARQMLNGYIPASIDLIELRKQFDEFPTELLQRNNGVSP